MTKLLHRIGWIGLTLVGALMVFAVASDLAADHKTGIPSDHVGTFSKLAGQPFAAVASSSPGVARYVTTLEVGYALHELTFALLFLVLVLVPVRRGRAWGWWACWAVMIANIGYTATFGAHDPTILTRSLAADVAVPVFLLLCAPRALGRGQMAGPATESHVAIG
jgi:hypothetical protein